VVPNATRWIQIPVFMRHFGAIACAVFLVSLVLPLGLARNLIQAGAAIVSTGSSLRRVGAIRTPQLAATFGMGGLLLIFATVSAFANPPLTEYAINKVPLLVVSLAYGFGVLPNVLVREGAFPVFAKVLSASAVALSVVAITTSSSRGGGRAAPWGLNPSLFGRFLALGAVFAVARYFTRGFNIWSAAAGALCISGVIATGSRTSLLGVAAVAVYFGFRKGDTVGTSRLIVLGAASLGFVALLGATIAGDAVWRFTPGELGGRRLSEEGSRFDLWRTALEGTSADAFGLGPGNYSTIHRAVNSPHNIFLEYWVELGFAAFLILAVATVRAARAARTLKSTSQHLDIVALFLYSLTNMIFSGEATYPALPMYAAMAIILVIHGKSDQVPVDELAVRLPTQSVQRSMALDSSSPEG